jgi:glucokinase
MQRAFLGIEIGGSKLQIVAGDEAATIVGRERFVVDPARGAEGIRRQIATALPALTAKWKPAAVGVGFGGPVDWKKGRVARSHQIEGWSEFDLGGWLRKLTGLPVAVENDSNLATLAEATHGAGAGFSPVFYFNLGSGVGGGLVIEERIYHGRAPGEVEFGHLLLDQSGVIVEQRCSGWAIDRRLRALAAKRPASPLARLIGSTPGGEAKHLRGALDAGDAVARRVLSELAGDLGFALSHVVHLFHPEVIVLGGGLSLVGEPLCAAVAEVLPRHVMEVFRLGLQLKLAALGEDAVPAGALLLARDAKQATQTANVKTPKRRGAKRQ